MHMQHRRLRAAEGAESKAGGGQAAREREPGRSPLYVVGGLQQRPAQVAFIAGGGGTACGRNEVNRGEQLVAQGCAPSLYNAARNAVQDTISAFHSGIEVS
jgi:hypothetical protein